MLTGREIRQPTAMPREQSRGDLIWSGSGKAMRPHGLRQAAGHASVSSRPCAAADSPAGSPARGGCVRQTWKGGGGGGGLVAGSCVEAKLRARSDVRQTCSAHRGAGKQSFVVVDGIETYTHTHTGIP